MGKVAVKRQDSTGREFVVRICGDEAHYENKTDAPAEYLAIWSPLLSLTNGSISYQHVLDLASERAFSEHPNVYRSSFDW
jgi:hypothetical protein